MATATSAAAAPPMLALNSAERPRPRNLANLGVLVAVASGTMAFGALVAAWVNVSHFTKPWPPKGTVIQNYTGSMLTITMVMASLTAEWSVYAVRRRQSSQARAALAITLALGAAFLNLLWFLGRQVGFGPGRNAFATIFFAMISLSGVAAAAGMVVLAVVLARVVGGQVAGADSEPVRAAAFYWHFVTLTWLVLALVIWTP